MGSSSLLDLSNIHKKTISIVDGMNLCMRNYYGIRLTDSTGYPTGILYGGLNFLKRLKACTSTSNIVFLWEGHTSLRKSINSNYKKSRKPQNNILFNCVDEFQKVLSYLGIKQVSAIGLEADDLAGYFINKYKRLKNRRVVMYSNDKDWWQYLSDNVYLYDQKVFMDLETLKLKLKLGFSPDRIWLYKSLTGDSSDSLRGIPHFPKALAVELCKRCSNLSEVYEYSFSKKFQKWKSLILKNKKLLDQNVLLIQYQPKWVKPSAFQWLPCLDHFEKVKKILKKRNINTISL